MKTIFQLTAFITLLTACRPELTTIPCASMSDMGLQKKGVGTRSEWLDISDRDMLEKICNSFAAGKELNKPIIEEDWTGYKLHIWFNERSMLDLDIIITPHDGTVVRNGKKYYRNNALVELTEKMFTNL